MKSRQLIISPHYDGNAAAAAWGLRESGHEPVWPHSGTLADSAIGAISLYSDGLNQWRPAGGIGEPGFSSVLYRWPRERTEFANTSASDHKFLHGEWRALQNNVYALHSNVVDALWANPPDAALRTENKMVQLQHAARCGVRFPNTLVSNDPEKIASFVASGEQTIYKPFRSHSWVNNQSGSVYDTPATILDCGMELNPSSLALCPGIYQSYVNKRSDLRVTMIGDRFFSARIRSHSQGAFTDWRPAVGNEADFLVEPYELPQGYQARLKRMMNELGIVYGAIDLAEEQNGDLVFLEVNQIGQFQFVESWLPELPLLQAYCAMLAEGRTSYSLSSCPDVSLRRYLASTEFAQWRSQIEKMDGVKELRASPEGIAA